MANRSYLYATDRHPDAGPPGASDPADARVVGLSEAGYRIPLSYRLLLSGAPSVCTSLIWGEHRIGLVGDGDAGRHRLDGFLDRLAEAAPELAEACADTRAFLAAPANRRRWIVLEAGELFDMHDEPLDQQVAALLDEIQAVNADADRFLGAVARRGDYEGETADARTDRGMRNALFASGVGYWDNVLYFDLGPEADEAVGVDAFATLHIPAPPAGPPRRPPVPFWGPLLSTAALALGAILTGLVEPGLGRWAFGIRFLGLYAGMTGLWTLGVWGVWWVRFGSAHSGPGS